MLRRKILVVDCTALLFRYHYSKSRTPYPTPKNVDIGGVVGVLKSLLRMLEVGRPMGIAAVFDAGRRTFRNDLFPAYKEHREPTPDELRVQFPILFELVQAMGIPCFRVEGFEADDLMATFAAIARGHDIPTQLISIDKDLHQLVNDAPPYTQQVDIFARRIIDESVVMSRLGVPPKRVVDYQSMVGDSADNIPGIKGVGPKTAAQLIQHFPTLDAMYDDIDSILSIGLRGAKRIQQNLMDNREQLILMRELVTLRQDVPLELNHAKPFRELRWTGINANGEESLKSYGAGWFAKRTVQLSESFCADYASEDENINNKNS